MPLLDGTPTAAPAMSRNHGTAGGGSAGARTKPTKTTKAAPMATAAPAPQGGPGTEFAKLAALLGIKLPSACSCKATMQRMNLLGPGGCRRERAHLIEQIQKNAAKISWLNFAGATIAAITTGLAFSLSATDPVGSLFDEAVRRAEKTTA